MTSATKIDPARLKQKVQVLARRTHNNRCVDCGAPYPKWATITFGAFICMRCSGVHRMMGTHISRVRSINLDSWEVRAVKIMITMGNERVNQLFEANLSAHDKIGESVSDQAREAFIRAKYVQRRWFSAQGDGAPGEASVATGGAAPVASSAAQSQQAFQQQQQQQPQQSASAASSVPAAAAAVRPAKPRFRQVDASPWVKRKPAQQTQTPPPGGSRVAAGAAPAAGVDDLLSFNPSRPATAAAAPATSVRAASDAMAALSMGGSAGGAGAGAGGDAFSFLSEAPSIHVHAGTVASHHPSGVSSAPSTPPATDLDFLMASQEPQGGSAFGFLGSPEPQQQQQLQPGIQAPQQTAASAFGFMGGDSIPAEEAAAPAAAVESAFAFVESSTVAAAASAAMDVQQHQQQHGGHGDAVASSFSFMQADALPSPPTPMPTPMEPAHDPFAHLTTSTGDLREDLSESLSHQHQASHARGYETVSKPPPQSSASSAFAFVAPQSVAPDAAGSNSGFGGGGGGDQSAFGFISGGGGAAIPHHHQQQQHHQLGSEGGDPFAHLES